MQDQIIVCPQCAAQIPLTKALTDPILVKYKEELSKEMAKKEQELNKKSQDLESIKKNLEEREKEIDVQVQNKLKTERVTILKQAEEKAKESVSLELKDLKNQANEMSTKLKKAEEQELQFLKEKRKLQEREKNVELELQRKLAEEKIKIEEATSKRMAEEQHLKDMENDKKFRDAQKQIEELKRKLEQGSQQAQGEILELELEEILKAEFPLDEILPVEKGVSGADVIQKVFDRSGRLCGTIIWEFKRTKAWSDGWITKLKDDQRAQKAEIAVLVSITLPKEVQNFHFKDGIWITNTECSINLAHSLRINLMQVAATRFASVGKNEKMEVVWNYLTGTEFKQRVDAIVEAFAAMKGDLEKEKRAYQKIWAKREKQIQRVIDNTFGMHGDLEGLIGSSLPQIKLMELPTSEETSEPLQEE